MKRGLLSNEKLKPLSRAVMQSLTVKNIALKVLPIFKNHIGRDNAITRGQLFKRLFKRNELDTLEDWLRFEFVKKAMHLCRQRTKCFIGSRHEHGVWNYFVVNSERDAQYYVDILNKNIKRMRVMQQRAVKAGREKWGEKDWILEDKNSPKKLK